jgi:hypothetical protein
VEKPRPYVSRAVSGSPGLSLSRRRPVRVSPLLVQVNGREHVFADAFTVAAPVTCRRMTSTRPVGIRGSPRMEFGWTVEDVGSTNGTWFNGVRVWAGPVAITRGDRVCIGRTELIVVSF